ncbi:MAG: hypothetical protein EHM64_13360 [Ignavibacteriae bacterium]|nr:MAG: hypothetical protein EHM64_13360 [Ignavibacteriota bacterium]
MTDNHRIGINQRSGSVIPDDATTEEKPPFLGSWKNIYLAVLVNLTVLIILFYFISEAFQ